MPYLPGLLHPAALVERTSDVTRTVHDPIELLRNALEEQYQRHTGQLSELIMCSRQLDRGGYDEETLVGLIVSSRRALADTAEALRRMAEGTYGTCKRCAASIPLERLEILPQTRFCLPCQRKRAG
jgi:DnaK suppressor protein